MDLSVRNHRNIVLATVVAMMLLATAALCATTALAATAGSITVDCRDQLAAADGHTYSAYRLFTGDIDSEGRLSDATTDGCMDASFYEKAGLEGPASEMVADMASKVASDSDGSYVVSLSRLAADNGKPAATFGVNKAQSLEPGWYLLVSDAAQPAVVLVADSPVTISEKSVPPHVTKQVSLDGSDWTDAVSVGTKDTLRFKVEGTLPSNFGSYSKFPCSFVDTPSEGLVPDAGSVRVAVAHADGTTTDVSDGFESAVVDGRLTVSFDDLKTLGVSSTDTICVTYDARLDATKAALGFKDGNPNSVVMRYRRSPSFDAYGETPPATTVTYSFGLRLTKVDAESRRALSGAAFTLTDSDGQYWQADGTWGDDAVSYRTASDGTLSFEGLASGTYTLHEVSAPDGYAKAADATVTISDDVSAKTLDAEATGAAVTAVDASAGTADVEVADEPVTRQSRETTGGGSSRTGNNNSRRGVTGAVRDLYKTGTGIAAMLIVACGIVAAVAGAIWNHRQRRAGDE